MPPFKRPQRSVFGIVVAGLFLLFGIPVWSQTLQIATEEFPPYNYRDNGQITGMSTEVVLAACKAVDLPTEINVYPWARTYEIAQTEPNTLIFSIARSPGREKRFQWAGTVAPAQSCFFALRSRTDIRIDTLAEARKYYIITQLKGWIAQVLLKQEFVEGKHFFGITSADRAYLMLRTGRGDLLGYPELVMYHVVKNTGLKPERAVRKVYCFKDGLQLYAAFSLNTPRKVVERFQTGLQVIKSDGTYQIILEKYLK